MEQANCYDGGGGGSGQPPRPSSDRTVTYAPTPSWPSLWVGGVISGEKECGSTSGSSSGTCSSSSGGGSSGSNLSHSLIITQLDSGEQWGGDFTSFQTLSMESIGDQPDPAEEVVERRAYT